MLLWKRFVASVLDKIAILIIFVLVMLFIQYTPYTASGHMGRYIGMMSIPPSHYDNIDKVPKERESKTIEISEYYQKQEAYNLSKEGKQTCLVLDLTITIWFIIINVLYYLLSELIVGASFFKALLGGKLYDYDGNKLGASQIIQRNFLFGFILGLSVLLRFILNINYIITLIMFFILYDIYIFKSKQNILDKLTRCYLLGKPYSLNKDNTIKETNLLKSQIIESDSSFYMNSMELNEQMRNEKQRETIKPKVFKTKIKIVWFLFVILSLYPIHNILSYFFADYYNLSNYHLAENHYNEKASSNFFRKAYEKRNRFWNEFPKEKFAISRHLPHSNSEGKWRNPKYGPIPEGKLISTYEGSGTASKIAGYKDVKYFYWVELPLRTIEEYYKNNKPKMEKVYYTKPEPYYREYSYRNSISTYSLNDLNSIFTNCKWLKANYLNKLAKQLNANGIPFKYIKIGNNNAIKYSDKDYNITRIIGCANGNAYLLETEATEATENQLSQSDLLCSSISLNHFQIVGGYKQIIIMFCLLIIFVTIAIVLLSGIKYKMVISNRYAFSLYCVAIGSIVASFAIAMYQSYYLFTDLSASCFSVFILAGSLFTVTFVTTPLCVFYYRKSKEKWKHDYLVPSLLKRTHYDTIQSDAVKKLYISLLCFPLMVFSLLPFGIFIVLFYSVPILLVCTIIIWFNKWHHWVKVSKKSE